MHCCDVVGIAPPLSPQTLPPVVAPGSRSLPLVGKFRFHVIVNVCLDASCIVIVCHRTVFFEPGHLLVFDSYCAVRAIDFDVIECML